MSEKVSKFKKRVYFHFSLTFLPLFKQVFITMSSNSAQDVILCNVCTTSAAQVNCENCQVKLCSACLSIISQMLQTKILI